MIVKLLTEHNLEFLSLKGGCRCSSESTLVKMPHCWKSHLRVLCVQMNIKKVGNQRRTGNTCISLGYKLLMKVHMGVLILVKFSSNER